MPRHTVDKSLFDPIEVDIAGKVYTALPFSPWLIREIGIIENKSSDNLNRVVEFASLLFGVPVSEVEKIDMRALTESVDYVLGIIRGRKSTEKPKEQGEAPGVDDGKNEQKPADAPASS